jgi:hypothetical protein
MSRNKTVSDHKRDNTLTRNLGTHDGAGIVAERDLQLPPRDSQVTEKTRPKKNGASNKAAHYGNPAASTADASIASGEAETGLRGCGRPS